MSIARLKERVTRVYGLKAALNILDVVTDHRNRFLGTLRNSTDPRMNRFYHEQIGNINKTVQNLQGAAASILQTTENIITNATRWREAVAAGHSDGFGQRFNNANHHAQESIRLNTQYAEAIRAGDPQAARDLAQEAQTHTRQAELLYSATKYGIHAAEATAANNHRLATRWSNTDIASFEAAEVTAAGNQPVADLYTQVATCYRNAFETTLANNEPLAIQWQSAAYVFLEAASAREAGRNADADRFAAEAIARSINRTWSQWAAQTFFPGAK